MTFFIFLTCAFQLTAILQYSHNVCPHQRSSVKTGWIFLSICKCKGCSYLLVSPLFLSQPPILNFLVQIWLPFWEIPQIPPIHHGNSSSPHPFSNELVLFLPDPLVIQTAIYSFLFMTPQFSVSPSWIHAVVTKCICLCLLYPDASIKFLTFHFFSLSTFTFLLQNWTSQSSLVPHQSLFLSLLLINHLIWCLLLTNFPKGQSLWLYSFIIYAVSRGLCPWMSQRPRLKEPLFAHTFCIITTVVRRGTCDSCADPWSF